MLSFAIRLFVNCEHLSFLIQYVVASNEKVPLYESNRLSCLVQIASYHFRIVEHCFVTKLFSLFDFLVIVCSTATLPITVLLTI